MISTDAAYEALTRLAEDEGLLAGPSSGTALAAGLQFASRLASTLRDALVVVVIIFPDAGARYVTEGLLHRSTRAG